MTTFIRSSGKSCNRVRKQHAKAVLWDMDGTLIDSEPVALKALAKTMSQVGVEPRKDVLDAAVGMSANDLYAMVRETFGVACPMRNGKR